jgi:hypothetical protein
LIAAEREQFLLHKLQIQNIQVWAVFGAEKYIFWQPMAARLSISLWQFYGTQMVAIFR